MNTVQLKTQWANNIQIQKQLQWVCASAAKRYFETQGGPEIKLYYGCLKLVLKSLEYGIVKCQLIEQTLKNVAELSPEIEKLFLDPEIFKCFQTVLLEGVKLIFDYSISWFRVAPELRFASCLLKLYINLESLTLTLPAVEQSYRQLLNTFEYQFMNQYNIANCNIIHLDQVRDLFAKNHGLISPPILSINDIEKRGYFRLLSTELNINDSLVEVAQLKNGQLAVFLVNSKRLPYQNGDSKKLINELMNGNWELFHLGRTLLFQTVKQKDLTICNETAHGVELVSNYDLITKLQFTALDEVAWVTYWKIYFQNLFSDKSRVTSKTNASMLSSSHNFQNFKMKHTRLSSLRPSHNKGIALHIPSDIIKNDHNMSDDIQEDLDDFKFDIHPSKPVITSNDNLHNDDDTNINSPSIEDASLRDIEFLSYDKLVALDKSLQLDLSPKILQSPQPSNYKTVSHSFSLDKINNISQNIAEVSDSESIISNDNEDDDSNGAVFNPSVEDYRPQLLKRKSSSLFNIFTSKNKKNLKIETSGLNNDSTPTLRSASSTRTFFSVKSDDSVTSIVDQYIENPDNLDIQNSTDIFKCKISKASYWENSKWQILSTIPLLLNVVMSNQGILLILQNPSNTGRFKLITKITPLCKNHRSTAKDIQLTIPKSQILASVFSSVAASAPSHILSLRSDDIERLKNVIDHCVKGTLPPSLTASSTSRTLSSKGSSSCMSKSSGSVSRSSTEISDLDVKVLSSKRPALVLSDIKTRLHTKTNNKWTPHRIGLVNIYHVDGTKPEIKFELSTDKKETLEFKTKTQDLKRLGRTGLSLVDNSEYLFEFPNSVITEQVYRNIVSCNNY